MNENEYCLVSKELLVFLKWICENEPEIITKIVSKAWKKGFKEVLENVKSDELNQTDLQESVFDFFSIMETCIEKYKKNSTKKILNLISEKIDPTVIASLNLNEEETEALVNAFGKTKEIFYKDKNFLDESEEILTESENKELIENQVLKSNKDLFLQEFLKNWEPKDKILN